MYLYGLGVIAALFVIHGYAKAGVGYYLDYRWRAFAQPGFWLSLSALIVAIPTLWVSGLRVWQYSLGVPMFAQEPLLAHIMVGIGGAGMHCAIVALCFNNPKTCWHWLLSVGAWSIFVTCYELFLRA